MLLLNSLVKLVNRAILLVEVRVRLNMNIMRSDSERMIFFFDLKKGVRFAKSDGTKYDLRIRWPKS